MFEAEKGFRLEGFGFKVRSVGLGLRLMRFLVGFEFRVLGLGFGVLGFRV